MIIIKTPLRMSFAGGGSDIGSYYHHGYGSVVSTAIDKYMYVFFNKTFDARIRVIYSQVEYVDEIDEIKQNLAREAFKLVGISGGGIDIAYMGDMLPAHTGSGLGASSSLTIGILNALHTYKGDHISPEILAQEACQIEIEILSRPIGKQDQYATAFGGLNYIQFDRDDSVTVTPLNCSQGVLEELKHNLLLFYTGLKTQSDNILTELTINTQNNTHILSRMVELAKHLKNALENNNLNEFGNILHEGWLLKQRLATAISNKTIDNYYQKAREAGAIGGKILGSGGGGFLLLYCKEENQTNVRNALINLRETSFNFESEGSKIIYNSD
ncbi:GHMP kinase [Chloroflexota bacterium]